MTVLDIHVTGERPEVIVDPAIRERAVRFHFDTEQYAAGLEAMHVPTPVVDTLKVVVQHKDYHDDPVDAGYNHEDHQIDLLFTGGNESARRRTLWGASMTQDVSEIASYELARTAHLVKDFSLRRPDTLKADNSHVARRYRRRMELGVAGSFVGAAGGSEVAEELLKWHPVFGVLGGAAIGAFCYVLPMKLVDLENTRNRVYPDKVAWDRLNSQARVFASSDEAKTLFAGTVSVKFVENS